ncbi:VCBS repeat-containing protein [Chryseolinea sp. T2]|uniref:VCBS repeat-containing protein n=1 Tax=Chryseolinea sp. T2 TaxID=3129255 RepID=UPI0030769D32
MITITVSILLWTACKNHKRDTFLQALSPAETGVSFENTLKSSDDFNIIEYLYFYNGGGVAAGDINNDGLTDLYFSSNQESNRLYLNKGQWHFEDITEKAGVQGSGNWKTGVTMADVNGDGLLDIFSCGVGGYKKFDGANRLYINNGDLTFSDSTEAYGLSFQGFSSQASFFDYDNDGDLDMFLVNHAVHTSRSLAPASDRLQSDARAGDKLYRNERIPFGQRVFKEVTSSAGILSSASGYGLSVSVSDLNRDGYQDLYVANDFHENDYLYINDGNGSFGESIVNSVPHTSRFSMGVDIADINNDGWSDIFSLDMLPRDEVVIKTTAGEDPFDIYDYKLKFGYHHQYARNALQLNRGLDNQGQLMFSDIAPLAGVEATDWSWGPVIADFDHDGLNDIFVANGIAGRPNDMDYINYISSDSAQRFLSNSQLIGKMPGGAVPNMFFRNCGSLRFCNVTEDWIGKEPSLSNGATSADLDNDGDLDLVVNNMNATASIFRNNHDPGQGGYLKIKLKGNSLNRTGVGASVALYAGGNSYVREQIPARGWLSSTDHVLHFGLPTKAVIDSIVVNWPGGKKQRLAAIALNQTIEINQHDANAPERHELQAASPLLKMLPELDVAHREDEFVPFNRERLMPTAVSMEGPGMVRADVNGDGRDDIYMTGGKGQSGSLYLHQANGAFRRLTVPAFEIDSVFEDVDAAFFDANGDGTTDLLVVSGGQEALTPGTLQPRLYLNDGRGGFRRSQEVPVVDINASCVRPCDFDDDGDVDLFIGASVVPGRYGQFTSQTLWRNNGKGVFEDVSSALLPGSLRDSAGMVTDAIWTDINADTRADLVIVGDWMPVTVCIQNISGKFDDATNSIGLANTGGWWRSIAAADFDHDGDVDLVGGNFGLNSRLRPAGELPLNLYISDIDNNGSAEPLMTYNNDGISYPFISRDQLLKQVPSLKRRFVNYRLFRDVNINDLLNRQQPIIQRSVHTLATTYFENIGGKFLATAMPVESQLSSVECIAIDDINSDGALDVVMAGNAGAVQPDIGRADASYGVILLGDGKGSFTSIEPSASGFVVRGQARSIVIVKGQNDEKKVIVGRNDSRPLVFSTIRHENSSVQRKSP